MKINWKDYIYNATNSKNWKPTIDEHFLDHLLPALAAIPLRKNDAGKISSIRTFQQMPETITTVNGPMDGEDAKRMLGFLYLMPRSKLLTRTQGKDPRLGSLTPLPMYAHKLHNDVPYEAWDKSDSYLKYFLGSFLEGLASTEYNLPIGLTTRELMDHRAEALKYHSGPKAGTSASLTDYKCNIARFRLPREEDDEDYREDNKYLDFPVPKPVMIMMLQIWIANVALRKPGIMILDPRNWDSVPKAIDSSGGTNNSGTPWSMGDYKPEKEERSDDATPWD